MRGPRWPISGQVGSSVLVRPNLLGVAQTPGGAGGGCRPGGCIAKWMSTYGPQGVADLPGPGPSEVGKPDPEEGLAPSKYGPLA